MFDSLVTAIAAISVLAVVSVTDVAPWVHKAEQARLQVSSHAVETAFTSYYVQKGVAPHSLDDLIAAGKLPPRDEANYEGLDDAFSRISRQAGLELM